MRAQRVEEAEQSLLQVGRDSAGEDARELGGDADIRCATRPEPDRIVGNGDRWNERVAERAKDGRARVVPFGRHVERSGVWVLLLILLENDLEIGANPGLEALCQEIELILGLRGPFLEKGAPDIYRRASRALVPPFALRDNADAGDPELGAPSLQPENLRQ